MKIRATERTATGKVILCGEHSVVYGQPAIALPVSDRRARAEIRPTACGEGMQIIALDLHREFAYRDLRDGNPLKQTVDLVLDYLGEDEPDATLTLKSDLPIGSGMGSGAAITAATVRALSAALGVELSPTIVSELTYEVEKIHHGTPSGIDNTVIAWEQPVYFVKGSPPEIFSIRSPFHLVIANSGIASSSRTAITGVRRRWMAAPDYYNVIFNCIGAIVRAARAAIEQGALPALGTLLNENHELLMKMGVSLSQLDTLTLAARSAGALGAKLTGSGQGGNIIALVEESRLPAVVEALTAAGAVHLWQTHLGLRNA